MIFYLILSSFLLFSDHVYASQESFSSDDEKERETLLVFSRDSSQKHGDDEGDKESFLRPSDPMQGIQPNPHLTQEDLEALKIQGF